MEFRVDFNFEKGHVKSLVLTAENKEKVFQELRVNKEWFPHTDSNGIVHLINMNMVTSISIVEFEERPLSIL